MVIKAPTFSFLFFAASALSCFSLICYPLTSSALLITAFCWAFFYSSAYLALSRAASFLAYFVASLAEASYSSLA